MIVESRQIAGDYLSGSPRTSIPSSICASIRDDSRYPGPMGSPRALVVLVSLAACHTSGLEIQVVPPVDGAVPDHVRLFVGKSEEKTGSIAPEGFANTRYGNIWIRDRNNGGDILPMAPGQTISFGFLAEVDDTELGAIVAVGYTGGVPTSAGSLFHRKTGAGNVRVFQIQLHPAFDPRDVANRGKDLQVEIWGPSAGEEACLHLRNSRPDADRDHEHHDIFIVTEGNRDCDPYADDDDELECRADVHNTVALAKPDQLACAITYTTTTEEYCVLGGPRCVDGQPQTEDCGPSRFCAPPSLCNLCEPLSGEEEQDCLRDPYGHSAGALFGVFGIKCHIASQRDPVNLNGPAVLCETPLPLAVPLPPAAPRCFNATITTVGQPAADHIDAESMRFEVDVTAGCQLAVTARGVVPQNAPTNPAASGLVTVDREGARSMALPILLIVDPPDNGCSASANCTLNFDQTAQRPIACLTAPLPM